MSSANNRITAQQVFDLIKDIPNLELFLDNRVIQWHGGYFTIQSRGIDYILQPEDVLAIIVDAAKREMGEDYRGTYRHSVVEYVGQDPPEIYWACEVRLVRRSGKTFHIRRQSTEAAAVLAAFKAWKEQA